MDNSQYKATIGSLLYLIVSRPNVLFGVGLCARFQQDPGEVRLTTVKRIFRYLIETPNLGLYFKYNNGIYIHQTKYVKELLKKFKLEDEKKM